MEEQNIIEDSAQKSTKNKRPLAITIICVLDFIGAVIVIPVIFSKVAASIGSWYPPYLGFSGVVGFICMIGLWKMKRWSVYTNTIFFIINQIMLILTNKWNLLGFLMLAIITGIQWIYLKKMD
jgi:glycerol-3-phosphate acyltransferase PlsY